MPRIPNNMKTKIAFLLLLIAGGGGLVYAAPWDLNGQQYDQFGTSMINRLMPRPTGGANGIYVYDSGLNLPKLATLDSTLTLSGLVLAVNPITLAGKFNIPTGNTGQYIRGDGSLSTFPTAVSYFSNDAGYLTSITSGNIVTALGFTPYNAANPNGYVTAGGARTAISLTTTGSGTATYDNGTGILNVPTPILTNGTVTSITAGTGLSGGVITTTGTISMPNIGTAGTYSGITTDAQGRITAGTNASQTSQTRTLNSAYQISATRGTFVFYTVKIATTVSIGSNQDGEIVLEIASDSGFTTNVQTLSIGQNGQAISLAIALQSVQTQSATVSGYVPPAYYTRLRTVNTTGTPVFTYRAGQEILM